MANPAVTLLVISHGLYLDACAKKREPHRRVSPHGAGDFCPPSAQVQAGRSLLQLLSLKKGRVSLKLP